MRRVITFLKRLFEPWFDLDDFYKADKCQSGTRFHYSAWTDTRGGPIDFMDAPCGWYVYWQQQPKEGGGGKY